MTTTRRKILLGLPSAALLAAAALALPGCATRVDREEPPPVVFVHGNGDNAALWQTTIWRFESQGWPRQRLHAIDLPYPLGRDDDAKAQPGRTSTSEHMAFLRTEVDKVLKATGAPKVVLVGNSRGGNAIRNYIANGGGAERVSHAILGGTPNHGIWAIPGFREGNEFSGTGPFLTALNTPKNAAGNEVAGPVRWLTLRSDNNDKYALPTGEWIGMAGKPTGVSYDSPELKGATNIVLPRVDHRETAFSPAAFEAMHRFLTGRAPRAGAADAGTPRPDLIIAETQPVLGGTVVGLGLRSDDPASGGFVNNLPLPGARLAVYATDPATGARLGPAVYGASIGADGRWGPFAAKPGVPYEFEIGAPGYATTHIYRSPFPRGSAYVQLRAERIAEADRGAGAIVTLSRPRGYFDLQRDTVRFDGQAALPGVAPQGAGSASSKLRLPAAAPRAVAAEFNGERLAGPSWPASEGHVSILELTY